MERVIMIVAAIVFYKIVYRLTHKRLLTEEELEWLSKARRIVRINEIYSFTHGYSFVTAHTARCAGRSVGNLASM